MTKSLELTDEETQLVIEKAIQQAKFEKGQAEYNRLYAKLINSGKSYPTFSASQFYDLIVKLGDARATELRWPTGFIVDNDNRAVLKLMSLYFANDERFTAANDGFSLAKGLLIIGDVGCGKTQIMNLCRQNPHNCYSQSDCTEISLEYQQEGPGVIEYYSLNAQVKNKDTAFGQEFYGRFFDDLGSEESARNFGTERNVMAEIILQRYKLHPHHMTHFTSNLTMDQLADAYGKRVLDRLREMCNVIMFPASKSRRK